MNSLNIHAVVKLSMRHVELSSCHTLDLIAEDSYGEKFEVTFYSDKPMSIDIDRS